MSILHYRILPFAAILLLAGNSVFAQTATPAVQSEKSKQLSAEDVTTYVSEEAYALPWIPIKESNISWKKRVWYDIDATDLKNKAFSNDQAIPRKSYLVNILLQAAFDGKIKAYDAVDDRFTKELTRNDLIALISPSTGFNPDNVHKYRIKGDWLFLKEENKLVWHVVGIAPVIERKDANGNVTEQAMFWIFYFGDRDYIAGKQAYGANMNWDEVIEGRKFDGKIIKTSKALINNGVVSNVK